MNEYLIYIEPPIPTMPVHQALLRAEKHFRAGDKWSAAAGAVTNSAAARRHTRRRWVLAGALLIGAVALVSFARNERR